MIRPSRAVSSTGPSRERSRDSGSLPRAETRVVNRNEPVASTCLSSRHNNGTLRSSPDADVRSSTASPFGSRVADSWRGNPQRSPRRPTRATPPARARPARSRNSRPTARTGWIPSGAGTCLVREVSGEGTRRPQPPARRRNPRPSLWSPGDAAATVPAERRRSPRRRRPPGLRWRISRRRATGTGSPARPGRRKPPGSPSPSPKGTRSGSEGGQAASRGSGSPPLPTFPPPRSGRDSRGPPKGSRPP